MRETIVDRAYAKTLLPPRKEDGHKGDFGKLLVLGGSVGYTGAPYLAASAAVHSGCGLVYLGVPESIWAVEAQKCVSAMPFPLPETDGRLCLAALDRMLRCEDGSLYTGIASDVEKRFAMHKSGHGAKYTRSHPPVAVVYREQCSDKGAALRREAAIKKLPRAKKLELTEENCDA